MLPPVTRSSESSRSWNTACPGSDTSRVSPPWYSSLSEPGFFMKQPPALMTTFTCKEIAQGVG